MFFDIVFKLFMVLWIRVLQDKVVYGSKLGLDTIHPGSIGCCKYQPDCVLTAPLKDFCFFVRREVV